MNAINKTAKLEVGLNIPAEIGMKLEDVCTPALLVDLDAFERNTKALAAYIKERGIRLRAHAKTHKSADIALYQIEHGGACGVCCQKVSEAEALVAGGVKDVLVSNQVTDPAKIDRLAKLATKARILVCVDDSANIDDLSAAAGKHNAQIECLVEIDCGAGRCGVEYGAPTVELAKKIDAAPGLKFAGIQAYQGSAQHIHDYAARKAKIDIAIKQVSDTIDLLKAENLTCDIVGGAGTGTFEFEGASGIYNELQCGSYIFMDADYQRVKDQAGQNLSIFKNSLFVLTSIMSVAKPGQAVCDAGLKAHSVDSGLPTIFERPDLEYKGASDDHGTIKDPENTLKLNDKIKLIPGHCDPTCNLHDYYVGYRNGKVECLWPVTARGMGY